MMDKTAEIYRTPPADPVPQTMDSPNDLPAYTLYPDAGDPEILDTPAPLSLPPVPPPPSPAIQPPDPPASAAVQVSPKTSRPTVSERPVSARPVHPAPSLPRLLLRILYVLFALTAVVVYGDLLFTGGTSLLAEGAGRLALQNIFGRAKTVTVIPQVQETDAAAAETGPSAEMLAETPGETRAEMPAGAEPDTSPPASELPVPGRYADILSRDLSSGAPDGLGLINETPYTPDLSALAAAPSVIDTYTALESVYGKDCPAVLILHTHGTEAFGDQAENGYHTDDRTGNICAVGEALADTLRAAGIGVIHCTELFDAESFDMAYYNAARYIRQALEDNPSVRYILDIHRDAITAEDGTGIRPLSVQNNTEYAQLMFVVGTDHGGSGHTGWETNLSLAARLQSALHSVNPTLMRDINLRSASFNAQYAPGALLVEAGAASSSLEEAVRSIKIFGEALATEILGK